MERLSTSLRSRDVDEYSSNEHSQLAGEPPAVVAPVSRMVIGDRR
jgi:hypothetical protein